MDWSDDAIILSARRYGETSALVMVLSRHHGRHAGLLRGYGSRRQRGVLVPGNAVTARWRGRMPEMLGTFTLELTESLGAKLLSDRDRLAALSAACAVVEAALAEREPRPEIFSDFRALLATLAQQRQWPAAFVRWEVRLLADLGFGLDLMCCAVSGVADDLIYVSPRTGRAVSAAAGEPYRDRLLALPPFLVTGDTDSGDIDTTDADVLAGLTLTGKFLQRHAFSESGSGMSADGRARGGIPPARLRLAERFRQRSRT